MNAMSNAVDYAMRPQAVPTLLGHSASEADPKH
jgi:hypothetical protein